MSRRKNSQDMGCFLEKGTKSKTCLFEFLVLGISSSLPGIS
jgi:hypothetical protein